MIEIKNLHKYFKEFHALKGIDLNVKENEIYGFIGHNGAGKSTTMNILTGLSHFEEGTCIVNGKDVKSINKPGDLKVGFLPENPQFYPWMTAKEYLTYCGNHPSKQVVDETLSWAGLSEHANRRIKGFSRGMKQRLGMAVALIHDPKLLILDEPSSALDPEGRSEVLRLMVDLKRKGKTIIFSSHILSDIERICDRIGMIANGEMMFEKSLKSLLHDNILPIFVVDFNHQVQDELVEALKNNPEYMNIQVLNNTLIVQTKHHDNISDKLLREVIDFGGSVASFNQKKNDLESLFLKETR
jgi:ABC-2 type transport system ATP-binding protein